MPDNDPDKAEHILCSAIKYPWGEIVTGFRHNHIMKEMANRGIYTAVDGELQGFMSSKGKFYTRSEAVEVARNAGQIPKYFSGKWLYSENLWQDNTLFAYDDHTESKNTGLWTEHTV